MRVRFSVDDSATHGGPDGLTAREVLVAGVDAFLGVVAATCATGGTILRLAEAVPPPPWISATVWVLLSLTAPLAAAIYLARLRRPRAAGVAVLGRSATSVLLIATASGVTSSAVALGPEPVLFVVFGAPVLLAVGTMAIALSSGRRRSAAVMTAACLAVGASLLTSWPLRLTTWWWRGELAALAGQVRTGTAPRSAWVGPFLFVRLEQRTDVVFLITDPGGNGFIGLADRPAEALWRRCNLWSAYSVGGGWSLAFED